MSSRVSLMLSLALAAAVPAVACAADFPDAPPVGKQAGTFMIRLRAIGVIPENLSSTTSIGGHVSTTNQVAPEVDLSYFFTDHIAAELIAASTRHEVAASGTALGHVDVGSTYILPPTLTLQYHFAPHARLSPYIGAGLTAAWFYDSSPAGPTVTKFALNNAVGPAVQIGVDYNVSGHWFINVDAKQIFLTTRASINGGALHARTDLDPTVVGLGLGYRF